MKTQPHKGTTLMEIILWLVVVLAIIVGVITMSKSAGNSNSINDEIQNIHFMLGKTHSLLKQKGIYDYASETEMTGILIQFGGVPETMNITGDKTTGSATLQNAWSGHVTVAPVADANGNNTGFKLTYDGIPQNVCTTLAVKISGSAVVDHIAINGEQTDGTITPTDASSQCLSDKGATGTNTLEFISNT